MAQPVSLRRVGAQPGKPAKPPSTGIGQVELTERRREPLRRLPVEARERGDIPSATDLELAVDLLTGPAFYRRFIAHRAFPHDYATVVVDHVLTAIGHAIADKHEDPA